MTVNEFVRRIQAKVSMLSTGYIPIKLNGKDIECAIDLIENEKGYYINIKQPTKYLALTPEDIGLINKLLFDMHFEGFDVCSTEKAHERNVEVLRRFNEQREKI